MAYFNPQLAALAQQYANYPVVPGTAWTSPTLGVGTAPGTSLVPYGSPSVGGAGAMGGGVGTGSATEQLAANLRTRLAAERVSAGAGAQGALGAAPAIDVAAGLGKAAAVAPEAAAIPWQQLLMKGGGEGATGLAAKGLLGRAGIGYAAGSLAHAGAEAAGAPSVVSSALGGAALGAAIGAPFGGVGAVPGMAVGAIVGGLGGALADAVGIKIPGITGGSDSSSASPDIKKQKEIINSLVGQLSSSSRAEINATLKAASGLPQDQQAQIITSLLQAIPGQIGQEASQRKSLEDSLALQQQAVAKMAEIGIGTSQLGDAQAAYLNQFAQSNPSLAPLLQWDAFMRQSQAHQMANAFTGSVAAQPVVDQMQAQLAQLAQLQQQASAQGNQSFSSLLNGG